MKRMSFLALIGSVSLLWAAPSTIRFQGRLTDGQGRPVVGPSVNVRFSLYGVASGGATVWQGPANQTVATNEAGLFSTDMAVPMEVVGANEELYLQVHVNDGTGLKPLSPRQKLASVPYAMYSVFAASAAIAAMVAEDAVGSNQIKNAAVSTEKLAPSLKEALIPSGMIGMFAGSCPSGWAFFEPLNGHLPIGVGEFSYTGAREGSWVIKGASVAMAGEHRHVVEAHAHNLSNHKHLTPLGADDRYIDPAWVINDVDSGWGGEEIGGYWTPALSPAGRRPITKRALYSGPPDVSQSGDASPNTNNTAQHTHEVKFDGQWRPPHVGVVYCVRI